jgi:hypothetical protein
MMPGAGTACKCAHHAWQVQLLTGTHIHSCCHPLAHALHAWQPTYPGQSLPSWQIHMYSMPRQPPPAGRCIYVFHALQPPPAGRCIYAYSMPDSHNISRAATPQLTDPYAFHALQLQSTPGRCVSCLVHAVHGRWRYVLAHPFHCGHMYTQIWWGQIRLQHAVRQDMQPPQLAGASAFHMHAVKPPSPHYDMHSMPSAAHCQMPATLASPHWHMHAMIAAIPWQVQPLTGTCILCLAAPPTLAYAFDAWQPQPTKCSHCHMHSMIAATARRMP